MTSDLPETPINNHEPIILLHGWGMNASVFEPLSNALSGIGKTLCIDLPGYGGNRRQAGLSFEDQAASLASQLPNGRLIGWSLGGLYAIEIARQNPGRFSQLILVCCNPCFVHRHDWHCAVTESDFAAFADDLSRDWSSTIRRFLSLQMLGDVNARQLVRDLMANIQTVGEPDAEVLKHGLDLLKISDTRSILAELEIPIKLILGIRDTLVPASLAKEILKVNSRIQGELITSAAHAPLLSHPDRFISLISD